MTPRHFAWQAWHLVTSTGRFTWQAWHNLTFTFFTFVLRGRRGTNGTGWRAWARISCGWPRHFAWQAWHLVTSTVRFTWQAWHNLTFTLVLRGRRGTHGTGWRAWARFSCGWPRHFAWQAWHLVTSTVRFTWHAWHNLTFTLVLRGRRGLGGALGPVLVADDTALSTTTFHTPSWSTTLRGRRGSHPPSFCVAGVALMALGGAPGPVLVADDAAALCVAGVALGHIHRSFHVAGVAQSLHLGFAWQAWHSWHWVARLGPF